MQPPAQAHAPKHLRRVDTAAAADLGAEVDVLERGQSGEEMKVWKMKLTVWARKRASSLREAVVMSRRRRRLDLR